MNSCFWCKVGVLAVLTLILTGLIMLLSAGGGPLMPAATSIASIAVSRFSAQTPKVKRATP